MEDQLEEKLDQINEEELAPKKLSKFNTKSKIRL
jgi:hypothetical protein